MAVTAQREANGVTLADVMIALAGVAVGFVVEPVRGETSRVVQVCGFFTPVSWYTSLYWTLARFVLPVALGLASALFIRCARFGRMPAAAEWLALVTLLLLLDPAVPGATHVFGPVTTRPMTYAEGRSGVLIPTRHVRPAVLCDLDPEGPAVSTLVLTMGLALVLGAGGGMVLRLAHRGGPAWVAVLVLLALGWAWLRIPVRLNSTEVVRFRYSWLTFAPVPSPTGLAGPELDWYIEARYALGRWPVGLCAAIPALAAARSLARAWSAGQRSRWTEWAGAALALVLGLAWASDELVLRPQPALLIRATVFAAWVAALGLPGWLVVGAYSRRVHNDPGRGATLAARSPDGTQVCHSVRS